MNYEATNHSESSGEILTQRSKAIVLGAAIGDTLGMPVEGWTPQLISKYLGRVDQPLSGPQVQETTRSHPDFSEADFPRSRFLNRKLEAGEWTDDTALLLAVAQGIIDSGGFNLDAVARAHVDLYESIKEIDPEGGWGAYGKTTHCDGKSCKWSRSQVFRGRHKRSNRERSCS